MKRLLILLLFPLMMFAQDSTLIGDVDCSGEVNSQDASLILQFVTNVIDELPCQENMTGLTPEQLQEIINMMDEQLSINYTGGGNMVFGEFQDITTQMNENMTNVSPYPEFQQNEDGFLYILLDVSVGTEKWFQLAVDSVSPIGFDFMNMQSSNKSYFTNTSHITPVIMPIKKDYYWSFSAQTDVTVWKAFWVPFESEESTTTTNSLAETGGSGFDYAFPEGLDGETVVWNLSEGNNYTVPTSKNLYITHLWDDRESYGFEIDGIQVSHGMFTHGDAPGSHGLEQWLHNPLILKSGQTLSRNYVVGYQSFYGILVDSIIEPITWNFLGDDGGWTGNQYTVPLGKTLVITNLFNYYGTDEYPFLIDGIEVLKGAFNSAYGNYSNAKKGKSLTTPLILHSTQTINITALASFNGYLVDEDYFSSAGSGSISSGGDGTMSVSTFGDTLTLNGESIIVPGISYSNVIPEFGSVTDVDGNVYQTVIYGDKEWMTENLRTTSFNNGDAIIEECYCGTNVNSMCSEPYWTYYACDNQSYGHLYNGYVILDDREICPVGWHIATSDEWQQVFDLFTPPGSEGMNAILIDGTNESYLSIPLGGEQGPGGSNYAYGAGNSITFWQSNLVRTYVTPSYGNSEGTGTGANYDYMYCRCVKD